MLYNYNKVWITLSNHLSLRSDSTKRSWRVAVEQLTGFSWLSGQAAKALVKLRPEDALGYLSKLKKADKAPKTIAHRYSILCGLYNVLLRAALVRTNPFSQISFQLSREVRRRTKALTPSEVRAILALPDYELRGIEAARDQAILALLFGAALRRSEVARLCLSDICVTPEERLVISVERSKGKPRREIPLPDWAGEMVFRYFDRLRRVEGGGARDNPFLFPSRGSHLGDRTINRIFQYYARQVRPDWIASHSGRATAITRMLENGVAPDVVAAYSGHSTIKMVLEYDKRKDKEKMAASKLTFES